jgi:hypothetical protein
MLEAKAEPQTVGQIEQRQLWTALIAEAHGVQTACKTCPVSQVTGLEVRVGPGQSYLQLIGPGVGGFPRPSFAGVQVPAL